MTAPGLLVDARSKERTRAWMPRGVFPKKRILIATNASATETKHAAIIAINLIALGFRGAGGDSNKLSTVVPPQCGQATVRPAASTGNSMWPPHNSHAAFA